MYTHTYTIEYTNYSKQHTHSEAFMRQERQECEKTLKILPDP